MLSHKLRYQLIFGVFVLCVVAAILCGVLGVNDPAIRNPILTALAGAAAALFDARKVEKRRKDPTKPAVVDDILKKYVSEE